MSCIYKTLIEWDGIVRNVMHECFVADPQTANAHTVAQIAVCSCHVVSCSQWVLCSVLDFGVVSFQLRCSGCWDGGHFYHRRLDLNRLRVFTRHRAKVLRVRNWGANENNRCHHKGVEMRFSINFHPSSLKACSISSRIRTRYRSADYFSCSNVPRFIEYLQHDMLPWL